MTNDMNQKGFTLIMTVLVVFAVLIAIGGGVFYYSTLKNSHDTRLDTGGVKDNQFRGVSVDECAGREDWCDNSKAPDIAIKFETEEGFKKDPCNHSDYHGEFKIYKDNQEAASIITKNCEVYKSEILSVNNKYALFSILPGGAGGHIVYGKYTKLYKLNFNDNSLSIIFQQPYMTDIDVSGDTVVYNKKGKTIDEITVKSLVTGREKDYNLPPVGETVSYQIGSFKFSPNARKIAMAVTGYGSANQFEGEIYILNLENGSYSLYKRTSTPPVIEGWVNNTELLYRIEGK